MNGAIVTCALAAPASCGSAASTDQAGPPTTTSERTARACPGKNLTQAGLAQCPSPASTRPGGTCDVQLQCPSIDLIFGMCRCVDSEWSCDHSIPPAGYDPFPDCPADGAATGAACYLEGSKCVPASTSACFTSDVPLCECKGHAWACE